MTIAVLILACGLGVLWFVGRGKSLPAAHSWPLLLRFLPLLLAAAILLFYFSTEWGVLEFSRTEQMYGLFVVVLLPLSGMLLLLQLAIYLRVRAERKVGLQDPHQQPTSARTVPARRLTRR